MQAKTISMYNVKLGHKNVACITGPSMINPSSQRAQGFIDTLNKSKITVDKNLTLKGDFGLERSYNIMKNILKFKQRPSAIFSCNDMMSIGVYKAAQEMKIKIPDDLSIIGFDNIMLTSLVTPGLTTVSQPKNEIGKVAVNMLLERIKNKKKKNHFKSRTYYKRIM